MTIIETIIDFCNFFGVTPEKIAPLVLVIGTGFAMYNKHTVKLLESLETRLRGDIDSVKKDLDQVRDDIDYLRKDTNVMKDCVVGINNTTREIQTYIQEKDGKAFVHKLPKNLGFFDWAKTRSPLRLNKAGSDLSKASGMEKMVKDNINELLIDLEERNLETAYDVQQESFDVVEDLITSEKEYEKELKNFLFNNPKFKGKMVDPADLVFVGSLILRDAYLDRHEELRK